MVAAPGYKPELDDEGKPKEDYTFTTAEKTEALKEKYDRLDKRLKETEVSE